ncbi:MAG: hypothetical protein IKZ54_00860 [Bacteroidales bacterium]|nr:hypothetical protein [Bacteroidales bacterium]
MKNFFCFLVLCLLLLACTYDPPKARMTIINHSAKPVWVNVSVDECDTFPVLNSIDMLAYIESNKSDSYILNGTKNKPIIPNKKQIITLFFIEDTVVRQYSMCEISKEKLFIKVVLTKDELERDKYRYIYQ